MNNFARGSFPALLEKAPSALSLLDRVDGFNRQEGPNILGATDDAEAVQTFLDGYSDSPHTRSAYTKEITRLMFWAAIEKGKGLSDLTTQDIQTYNEFMKAPRPETLWCGPRRPRRLQNGALNPSWRPFTGPVSASGRSYALRVLNRVLAYLVDAGYLRANPVGLINHRSRRAPQVKASQRRIETVLDQEMEDAVWSVLAQMPAGTRKQAARAAKLRFAFAMGRYVGARIGELARDQYVTADPNSWRINHTWASFRQVEDGWWWRVQSKGLREGDPLDEVPVSTKLLDEIARYRSTLGLSPEPEPGEVGVLLPSPRGGAPMTTRQLESNATEIFYQASLRFDGSDPQRAALLRVGTFHWLRHTFVDRLWSVHPNNPRLIQELARHADMKTTLLYTHIHDQELRAAVEE